MTVADLITRLTEIVEREPECAGQQVLLELRRDGSKSVFVKASIVFGGAVSFSAKQCKANGELSHGDSYTVIMGTLA